MNIELNIYNNLTLKLWNLYFLGFVILLCEVSNAQSTLTISGEALFLDGTPAVEAGVILTFEESIELSDFTATDSDGAYSFSIELPANFNDECFEVSLLNCDGFFLPYSGCYTPKNTAFEFDFVFCEYGNSFCSSFITSAPLDNENIELSLLQFGVGPYTYLWNDGSAGSSLIVPITDDGEYCVTVTDSEACISEACILLDPVDPCFVFITETNGFENTTLVANGFGATEELNYVWSTGEETETIQVGVGGEYCVTISDIMGCIAEDCLLVTVDSSEWLECFAEIDLIEDETDQLVVSAFGVGPFDYIWSKDGIVVGNEEFIDVSESGNYCVEVKDAEDCIYETCFEYTFISDCSVFFTWSQPDGNPQLNAITSGVGPYSYSWNVGEETASISIEKSGFYCVSIEDSTGCETSFCEFVDISLFSVCDVDIVATPIGNNEMQLSLNHLSQVVTDDYTYIWSNGQTGNLITISEGGFYCVSVNDNLGCEFETCEYVAIDNEAFDEGLVISYINKDTQLGENAILELYEFIDNTAYFIDYIEPLDELGATGLYYMEFILEGDYLVRAMPINAEEYIPSYNIETPFWDESKVISVVDGGSGLNSIVNLLAIPINEVSGPGAIGGETFYYGEPSNVMLFQNGKPVRQETTEEDGQFLFEGLPYGTYTLIRELPGQIRAEVVVTISEFNPEELNIFLDVQVTSISESNNFEFTLFPNPSNDRIIVKSEMLGDKSSQIIIRDINGVRMEVISNIDLFKNSSEISLSNLESGVYFLTIQNENGKGTQKVIKL